MNKKKLFEYENDSYYIRVGSYYNNDRLAIDIVDENEEEYCSITVNISDKVIMGNNYVFINGDLTKETYEKIKDCGIIKNEFDEFKYNYGNYKLVEIDLDKLKEYDPINTDIFLNEYARNFSNGKEL